MYSKFERVTSKEGGLGWDEMEGGHRKPPLYVKCFLSYAG
jgi:hypothetical protein